MPWVLPFAVFHSIRFLKGKKKGRNPVGCQCWVALRWICWWLRPSWWRAAAFRQSSQRSLWKWGAVRVLGWSSGGAGKILRGYPARCEWRRCERLAGSRMTSRARSAQQLRSCVSSLGGIMQGGLVSCCKTVAPLPFWNALILTLQSIFCQGADAGWALNDHLWKRVLSSVLGVATISSTGKRRNVVRRSRSWRDSSAALVWGCCLSCVGWCGPCCKLAWMVSIEATGEITATSMLIHDVKIAILKSLHG